MGKPGMNQTEFYRRIAALSLYQTFKDERNAGIVLSNILREEPREGIRYVRETINQYTIACCKLLERVYKNDWYLIGPDREDRISEHFLNSLEPDQAAEIFQAMEILRERID